jgi:hypothetical protein
MTSHRNNFFNTSLPYTWYNAYASFMDFSKTNGERARAESKTAVGRLIEAIGYPERAPEGAASFTLRVDGMEILAEERDGRLILSRLLTDSDELLPTLAGYAAGRLLREEAVLATEPNAHGIFIWQDAPATADAQTLVHLFETFLDSCDWWRSRIAGDAASASESVPEMMIRP